MAEPAEHESSSSPESAPTEEADESESGRYEMPPPDEIRRRNRITGFLLLLLILVFVSIAVWARV